MDAAKVNTIKVHCEQRSEATRLKHILLFHEIIPKDALYKNATVLLCGD
jgi:hypothetical protein